MKLRFGFVSVLLLCLGLCSSCEDERFDTGSTMPDGQFIVDYTAEAGKATRALHENVPAGERINSLTYLLYSEEGTLLKRREVPGLNESGKVEEWPLTRENMSWEQREVLKDTLETNTTYHAVFIANIDSTKLWNNGTSSPLKRAGNYDDAYIELPDRAFTDGDMFYYFSKDINSADEGADRDNPYHCDVQLHRIVTRTDFFFEELPVWEGLTTEDEPATALLRDGEVDGEENGSGNNEEQNGDEPEEEGSGDDETGTGNTEDEGGTTENEPIIAIPVIPIYPVPCILPEEVQAYLQPYVSKVVGDAYSEIIMNPITTSTQEFLGQLKIYFEEKATEAGENDPDFNGDKTNTGYADRIETISTAIASGGESNQTFLNAILQESEGEGEEAQSKLYTHLQNWMLNQLEKNAELTALWKQFEKRKKPFYAEMAYDTGGGLNQFYLDRTKSSTGFILKTPRVAADAIEEFEGKTYRGFNVVGFANPEGNIMTTVNWYENETATQDETPYPITLYKEDGTQNIQTGQDINEKVTIQYRPVAGLELAEDWEDKERAVTMIVCNLETALPFVDTDTALKEAIGEALKSGAITGVKSSLNETVLTLQWPDLSKSEVLKITPEWKIAEGH